MRHCTVFMEKEPNAIGMEGAVGKEGAGWLYTHIYWYRDGHGQHTKEGSSKEGHSLFKEMEKNKVHETSGSRRLKSWACDVDGLYWRAHSFCTLKCNPTFKSSSSASSSPPHLASSNLPTFSPCSMLSVAVLSIRLCVPCRQGHGQCAS